LRERRGRLVKLLAYSVVLTKLEHDYHLHGSESTWSSVFLQDERFYLKTLSPGTSSAYNAGVKSGEIVMRTIVFLFLAAFGVLFWHKGGWILYALSPLALCWPYRRASDKSSKRTTL
jgi:hypothetical protein